MLQRKPTRIELRAEDKQEVGAGRWGGHGVALPPTQSDPAVPGARLQLLDLRREEHEARLRELSQQAGKAPLSPLFAAKKPTAAQRIGVQK